MTTGGVITLQDTVMWYNNIIVNGRPTHAAIKYFTRRFDRRHRHRRLEWKSGGGRPLLAVTAKTAAAV